MELIIDECVARSTRLILKKSGFELINVEDVLNPGIDDEKIVEFASNKQIPIISYLNSFLL